MSLKPCKTIFQAAGTILLSLLYPLFSPWWPAPHLSFLPPSSIIHFLGLEFFDDEIISFYKNLETLFSLKENNVLSEELYNAAVNGLYNSTNRYAFTVEKAAAHEDLDDCVEIDDDSEILS